MSADGELVLLDFPMSPFCMRVGVALAEKGLKYESRPENNLLGGKSELLLASNPIYKKVPVLLHNGKPLCESTIIVGYIDETWPSPPLMGSSPLERAEARFWADFVDKKLFDAGAAIWRAKADELEVVKRDFLDVVRQLEGALGEKDFFGGKVFGFVDIITIGVTSWFPAYEKYGGFQLEDHCPKFAAWMKRCKGRESVAKVIPDAPQICEFVGMLRKMMGIE
ncbi:hypothetical protein MLD38_022856 [Melastoma candidum]|uniref:Uncharacterized protein n=1 Tax=Melastoma candidum TaxID=119954 RepID=A0ACB9QJZ7_9MYRT|nr:hypothetical protein MLD38_022856 [Melastoma candidum]